MIVPERKVIESILFLADEPVSARVVGELLERPTHEVEGLLRELADDYEQDDRGFVLREVAGGWRLYTDPECAPWLERFVLRHSHGRLSPAALETLAIIAYRGPLSRAQISEIRGVESDGVVRTLIQRGLVQEVGGAGGPGGPALLGVTREFLEKMGVRSTGELPPLAEFMPDAEQVEEMETRLSPGG